MDSDKPKVSRIQNKWTGMRPEVKQDLKSFFASLTVGLMIRGLLVEPYYIPSTSMYPTLDVGDQIALDKISQRWRRYRRRDIVVFRLPETLGSREALIKRIVAIEGDTVEVKHGGSLYIDGEAQKELYVTKVARYQFGPVRVPPGFVFVLGDNRQESLDGHVWGFLPWQNIIGRATLKFWPPRRAGSL